MRSIPGFNQPTPNLVANDFNNLVNALNNTIPRKKNNNILIATWNIKKFSSLTMKWLSESNDSPRRDVTALQTIGEIISRFDVVAIQEVMGNLRSLRKLIKMLGSNWAFLMTDVTLGKAGGNERMAFVFDTIRVTPSGLVCELVIPPEWKNDISSETYLDQFARTPYAVSFRRKKATFILVTLHIDYGKSSADRKPELNAIAKWMYDWAKRENRWHHNLITLGDFNIDRKGDDLWEAFTSTRLKVPECLKNQPRSIFASSREPEKKYYDQIAWFLNSRKKDLIDMNINNGGNFDFLPYVYQNPLLKKKSVQYRISDHYPLWCEFII